ncbi:protein PvdJ(3) [Pseudomonas aeruginosa PA38182]|nr:protein PvdJ(3) [Pseudomonas aeruginosa PA38182]
MEYVELVRGCESAPCAEPACLHPLVEAQAARTPEATAVVHGEIELSYRELNRRANVLAHRLRAEGVGSDVPVGIAMQRSPELVVALLAVLKAGGAYVPMDPSYPAERLAFLAEDSGIGLLLTQTFLQDELPFNAQLTNLCLDGAVTLIQRFGSALNLNVHFHMLWLDGVYVEATELPRHELRLHRARAPTTAQLTQLAATIAHRVCRHLTRKGWLEGEGESAFLADSAAGDDSMDGLRMGSITYRIATGRDAGCKVVTLQTLPGDAGSLEGEAGKVGGFSLHAGVAAEAHESHKLEKLCRYITRPAISEKRLSIALQGRVRYQLKTPWRNGTTHVEWDAVDFIAKLAALVPPPRAHLTRFHGVFAPNANLRAQLTPSGRGKRPAGDAVPVDVSAHDEPRSPEEKRRSMSWAQRLKRVFSIDITTCAHCGGAVRIVASIEEPTAIRAIRAILAHFEKHGALEQAHYRPAARAPPPAA